MTTRKCLRCWGFGTIWNTGWRQILSLIFRGDYIGPCPTCHGKGVASNDADNYDSMTIEEATAASQLEKEAARRKRC